MKCITKIEELKAAIRGQSWEGDFAPGAEQTVSLAGALAIIDAHTVEADLVRREDVRMEWRHYNPDNGDSFEELLNALPAWDGTPDKEGR